MNARRPTTDELRQYLLETIDEARGREIAALLEADADLREALATEAARLEALGGLRDEAPPPGLSDAVMARLGDASEAEAHPGVPWLRVALAAGLVLVAGLIVLPWATNVRESARRSSAQGNLKQLGLVFKMYAGENQGRFPPLAPYEGVWMADLRVLYPEYLTTPEPLVNPRLPDAGERLERLEALLRDEPVDWERVHRLAAESLTYTGYVVDDVEEAERLANLRADARLDEAGTIPPLQEGVERFFITDINNPAGSTQAQSAIPVLFEAVYPEGERGALPLGINVLYMDGHVEFIRWGEAFPALREVGEVLPPPSDKPGEIE